MQVPDSQGIRSSTAQQTLCWHCEQALGDPQLPCVQYSAWSPHTHCAGGALGPRAARWGWARLSGHIHVSHPCRLLYHRASGHAPLSIPSPVRARSGQ